MGEKLSLFKKTFTLFVTMFGSLCAQTFNITGIIADSSTLQGISNATVKIVEYPQITAKTNSSGVFTLTGTVTATHSPQVLTPDAGRIELKENSVNFVNINGAKKAAVNVFKSNGSKIASAKFSLDGQGNKKIKGLWKTSGLYLVKIILDGNQYSFFATGVNSVTIPISSLNKRHLAKSNATCTLQVTASGYTSKNVTMAGAAADVGTIKLQLNKQ
jgi:hypothetical protein